MSSINQEFVKKIREWIAYDAEMADLKKKMDERRAKRDELNNQLTAYMRQHNLTKNTLDSGGNRIYYRAESKYNNISLTFLRQVLMIYFKNNQQQVENLMKFIMSQRTKSVKTFLERRPINK